MDRTHDQSPTPNTQSLYQGKEWQTRLALNLYDFHARQYDPATGRFLGIDPQNQFASGYVGMGNMPTMGVDPDGEWVFLIPIAVGAIANTVANWDDINNVGDFLGYAGVGALAGASTLIPGVGPIAAGAIAGGVGGLGNGLMRGQTGTDLLISTGVGALAGAAGGAAAQGLNGLGSPKSPLLDGMAKGAAGGFFAGGLAGGTATALNGGNFWNGAWQGARNGAIFGGIAGGAAASLNAAGQGFNPLTGNRTQSWLAKNPSLSTVQAKTPGTSTLKAPNAPDKLGPTTSTSQGHSKLQGTTLQRGDFAGKQFSVENSRSGHIFRHKTEHVNPQTQTSRQRYMRLFEEVRSNPSNRVPNRNPAATAAGVTTYEQVFNGGIVWVQVRNGVIYNAGVR